MSLSSKFEELEERKNLQIAEETILMRKALQSDDPHALIKAQKYLSKVSEKENRVRSFFVDPTTNHNVFGFLSTPQKINDHTLRRMASTSPIIKSIIETRVEQVADFLEPQPDKYSTGFIIRKKGKYFKGDDEEKVSAEDQKKIHLITEFLLKGEMDDSLRNITDDLNTWGRKTVKDSLTLDKMATEVIWNKAHTLPAGFVSVDASTIYFADNYKEDGRFKEEEKNIKKPRYVQVIQGQIRNEFFDDEMIFSIRNASTDIRKNGYGESELEVLIGTVTAMLQGDAYNANIFKIGGTPSGIFRVQGNINESRLREFKSEWNHTMTGYQNNGRLAFLEADKMEFQDLSKSNRDMEYSKFQEYLIKLACAVYKISPEEIGFHIQGEGSKSMFQDSGSTRIKYSKDKGLKPLLKFLQRQINQNIINKIDSNFEFYFVGLEMETEEKELEMAIKKSGSFKGLKEIRRERGLPDEIDEDDVILSPVYMQYLQIKQQEKMMEGMGDSQSDEFLEEEENPFSKGWQAEENPMANEFKDFVNKELT